jgi:hypothetical protein
MKSEPERGPLLRSGEPLAITTATQRERLNFNSRFIRVPHVLFFGVDILPEHGHSWVICLPKKPKTAWNFYRALWTC